MPTMQFLPILDTGETARLVTAHGILNCEVIAYGALPEHIEDFGALTAGTWDADNECNDLEMNAGEFAQFRFRILDDVLMRFNNLGSTRQWRTAKTNFTMGQYPMEAGEDFLKQYMFAASEFFVHEIDTPRFDFYCERALTTSRVKFSGWRFKIREIPSRGKKTIWISDWPTGAAK